MDDSGNALVDENGQAVMDDWQEPVYGSNIGLQRAYFQRDSMAACFRLDACGAAFRVPAGEVL